MAADSENIDTSYHLHYAQKVLNMSCCTWRSHPMLTWAPYLLCVLGKIKMKYKSSVKFGSAYINMHVYCPAKQE